MNLIDKKQLASMIDHINKERSENILTVEQPVEYIHTSVQSRIEQIEVGIHVDSFQTATVAAMRQNPNIIKWSFFINFFW